MGYHPGMLAYPYRVEGKKWSKKYKKSINCANPKGFSQKAHCAGRKKKQINTYRTYNENFRNNKIT